MKIEVGDRVTYKGGYIEIVLDNEEINYQTVIRDRKIDKVERIGQNGWEVVEEKKELLTEEEREFLKDMTKYYESVKIVFGDNEVDIQNAKNKTVNVPDYPKKMKFEGVERYEYYDLKELRIGGINYEWRKL